MVSLIIGEGTTNDNLSSIDWSLGNYFLSVSVDNVDYGASKLMAVPFAMYASKAENGMTQNQADAIKANTAKVGITNNQAAAITANTAKVSGATATEVGYLSGVTSNIQSQLNNAGGISALNALSEVVIDEGPWPNNAGNHSYYLNNSSMNNKTNNALGNTALGHEALSRVTDGYGNTGLGTNANYLLTEGTGNTALGYGTLFKNETGDYNVAIGMNSSLKITSGSNNVGVGGNTLNKTTTGSNNTAVGRTATTSSATVSNETMLGYGTTGQGTNTVTLGNTSVNSVYACLLYTSPSPRDRQKSRMPSSA